MDVEVALVAAVAGAGDDALARGAGVRRRVAVVVGLEHVLWVVVRAPDRVAVAEAAAIFSSDPFGCHCSDLVAFWITCWFRLHSRSTRIYR